MIINPASASTISVPATFAGGHRGNVHRRELRGDRRQVGRAQQARQQADAVEHHARGPGPVDGVLQCRLARPAAALEDAGQHVRRHARHFDRQEHGHQMVGRRHQAHAECRAEQQRIKVLPVLLVRQPRHPHQDDEPEGKRQQEHPEVNRERVVDQHASENLVPAGVREFVDAAGRQGVPECHDAPASASQNGSSF